MRSGVERCFMELFACIKMKKRADKMLHSVGLQLPLENTFVGSDNSIAHSVANVKTYRGYFNFRVDKCKLFQKTCCNI